VLRAVPRLLLLSLIGVSTASLGAVGRYAPINSTASDWRFAIADFDGDHDPDLADVQAGPTSSSLADYLIQLHLTSSGRQSIRLVAPSGGLVIEARDVNGDHAIDLVLATAWSRKPVAVLLNDGHGNFLRVEQTAFLGAFANPTPENWARVASQATEAVGPISQSRSEISSRARSELIVRQHADRMSPFRPSRIISSLLISLAGRAPPFKASRS
jgi:hypothetical protein